MCYEINGNWGECFGFFGGGGGVFLVLGLFFFAFKHFQTTKQRLSIKKGKLFFALHILSM